jgi:hypothetical protein
MEDVLDVYCQPYDLEVPRICMDEMGKNLVKDKYPPQPAKPGQVAREDYTYEKEGRANASMIPDRAPDQEGLGALHAGGVGRAVS